MNTTSITTRGRKNNPQKTGILNCLCGSAEVALSHVYYVPGVTDGWDWVTCGNCKGYGLQQPRKDLAIEAWNEQVRRAK